MFPRNEHNAGLVTWAKRRTQIGYNQHELYVLEPT